ncbi:type VII secretion target [Prauserella cavernicola]|uniref:ESX-1 secretion-associated protein n=1 Tax=Prauserella cavernicola TaxID=2800127 RepID=A0A934V433_9PSEU|nr:type VII secretion target [Prauserella cavernicola]MBK1784314.1 ESX-1 secretion-associated protein [Prauserella cavernicola]
MSEAFQVDPERIRAHAASVGGVKSGVDEAADAGGHVASLNDAYGWICQAMGLPEMLQGPQERVTAMIQRVGTKLGDDQQKLDESAKRYDEAELKVIEILKQLGESLDKAGDVPTLGGR